MRFDVILFFNTWLIVFTVRGIQHIDKVRLVLKVKIWGLQKICLGELQISDESSGEELRKSGAPLA